MGVVCTVFFLSQLTFVAASIICLKDETIADGLPGHLQCILEEHNYNV